MLTPDNEDFVSFEGNLYTQATRTYDTPNKEIEPMKKAQYELMQFTGLTDRNGKEIYEGDVVKYRMFDYPFQYKNGGYKNYEVRFSDGSWEIEEDLSLRQYCKECEVVGNIYENPELLKS